MKARTRTLWAGLLFAGSLAHAKTFQFGIIGDSGRETEDSASVRDSIVRSGVKTLVLPGDNLYLTKTDTYEKVWEPWMSRGLLLDIVAIGNHHLSYEAEEKFFNMPREYYAKSYDGVVKFLVLNSDDVKTAAEQAKWFDEELSKTTEPFVFPVYHHPSYTISKFHNSNEREAFQEAIRPLLAKYRAKLTAVLVGHDHLAELVHFDDLPVVVSGAVFECRKDKGVDTRQNGVHVKTAWYYDTTPHWARLDVDSGAGEATVRFIKASKSREDCTAHIETGRKAELEKNCVPPAF